MKLEVGMYFRDKDGYIDTIRDLYIYDNSIFTCRINTVGRLKGEIKKASHNLIDLVEVGDYVNGVRVDEIITQTKDKMCFRYIYYLDDNDVYTVHFEQIKSIVTKEQFASVEYKVGE